MKILIDMNLSPRWVDIFYSHNIEAVHWSSVGSAYASDIEIMAHAKANNYVVFTYDLDFSAILAINHDQKPSVIQIRTGDIHPAISGQLVVNALLAAAAEIEKGALITINLNKTRLHVLPLNNG